MKNNNENSYKIYITAIMQNESKYLEEWLNFHTKLGIDGFILYDNNTNKNERYLTAKICNKFNNVNIKNWNQYDDKSYFFGIPFSHSNWLGNKAQSYGKNKQQYAYDDAIQFCKKNNINYLLKIDIDEFLIGDLKKLKKYIQFNEYFSYRIRRINFGSNYHLTKPEGLIINNYIRREADYSSYKDLTKTKLAYSSGTSSHKWVSKKKKNIIKFSINALIICSLLHRPEFKMRQDY